MWQLVLVSCLWAFSFGLIKRLTGLDGAFISAVRLTLAFAVLAPFLRRRVVSGRSLAVLAGLGSVQFGVMYLAYNESFRFLPSYEIALFTLTTPILVTLLDDILERRFRVGALAAAALAVAGGLWIVARANALHSTAIGIGLVQLSNLAFAAGQVGYRRWHARHSSVRARDVFAWLYAGGIVVTIPATLARTHFASLPVTPANVLILLYLGLIASGAGFFLWNVGATRVSAGVVAAMNNIKIPLGIACSLIVFGEHADVPRLLVGGGLMALGVYIGGRSQDIASVPPPPNPTPGRAPTRGLVGT